MREWSRATAEDYRRLDLRAHRLLADVPLHDVWQLALPGGGPGRTIEDVRAALGANRLSSANPIVRALFAFRGLLGRLFGWDDAEESKHESPYAARLTESDRASTLVAPGTPDGPFRVLLVLPFESIGEIRNATVHAFSVFALEEAAHGYTLTWAIHVAPVGRITAFYMALIDPFRRFLVYPAILRTLYRSWSERFAGSD